jgi:hypothetical protein
MRFQKIEILQWLEAARIETVSAILLCENEMIWLINHNNLFGQISWLFGVPPKLIFYWMLRDIKMGSSNTDVDI